MPRANEKDSWRLSPQERLEDKKLFVHNLGELLSQTRAEVIGCELDDNGIATITYLGGGRHIVNTEGTDYMGILLDVASSAYG